MNPHETYMQQAVQEAAHGLGQVEPNPPVGAVIVKDDTVIGQGHHARFGGPHAERQALDDAARRGNDVRGATIYVTLEPCCAFPGKKTPPCTEAIIDAGISRAIIAMEDPDPNVAGRGSELLRRAGIDVQVGPCHELVCDLLRAYIKLRRQQRPWVIAKWAQTADGYVAVDRQGTTADRKHWITNDTSRRHAQQTRGLCDGVLVGIGTVLADDPALTDRRYEASRQPTRVVLDATLRTPLEARLVTTARQVPTLIATTPAGVRDHPDLATALDRAGVEVLAVPRKPARGSHPEPTGQREGVDIHGLLEMLGRRNWTRLLVEGGPTVLRSFLDAYLPDELHVYVAPHEAADHRQPHFDLADVLADERYRETAAEDLAGDMLYVLRKA